MADVLLRHTLDGGEIDIRNDRGELVHAGDGGGGNGLVQRRTGYFVLDHSPATAAYLSLFGGNQRDGGGADTAHLQWWANLIEPDEVRHYRSETQHLLSSLPAVPANLRRLEDAVGRDLAWMASELGASVDAQVSMPAMNRVLIVVSIEINGEGTELGFEAPWGAE